MKRIILFIPIITLSFAYCTNQNNSAKKQTGTKPVFSSNQLFLFQEDIKPGEPFPQSGAMFLTNKGNIIFNTINQQADTQSYFWGKYKLTDTSLTYLLTDEYYYPGKWDARWNVANPDYANGKTRKVKFKEVTLFKTNSDSLSFFRLFTTEEKAGATKKINNNETRRIDFWKYYETKEMKFYSWLYKQIPALGGL